MMNLINKNRTHGELTNLTL